MPINSGLGLLLECKTRNVTCLNIVLAYLCFTTLSLRHNVSLWLSFSFLLFSVFKFFNYFMQICVNDGPFWPHSFLSPPSSSHQVPSCLHISLRALSLIMAACMGWVGGCLLEHGPHTISYPSGESDSLPNVQVAFPSSSFSFAHGLSCTAFLTPVTSSYSWSTHRTPETRCSRSTRSSPNLPLDHLPDGQRVLWLSSSISCLHYAQKRNFKNNFCII